MNIKIKVLKEGHALKVLWHQVVETNFESKVNPILHIIWLLTLLFHYLGKLC